MRGRWLILSALLLAGCGTIPANQEVGRPAVTEPVPVATPSPSVPVSLAPRCLDPGVEISVGEVDGALGLRAVGITLRNCGSRNYTVDGYPDVQVLDKDRQVLDVQVLRGTENVSRLDEYAGPPRRIKLPPGGKAVAVLLWRNITTDQATMAKGEYLSVAPAGGQPAHTLTLSTDPGNTGKFAISPWTTPRS